MKNTFSLLGFILISIFTHAATIYVDVDATGTNNGSSWANAYTDLQDAIDNATSSDEIWVAEGTYYPTKDESGTAGTNDRDNTFFINYDIKLYGGFDGVETTRSQRTPTTNITILSGDMDNDEDSLDNCFHIMYFKGDGTNNVTASAVVDGFTFEDGNATGATSTNPWGGAIYMYAYSNNTNTTKYDCSPTINNNIFKNNDANNGGAIAILIGYKTSYGESTISNCFFYNNNTSSNGGAVYTRGYNYDPVVNLNFINCVFYNNHAPTSGGAVCNNHYNDVSNISYMNCSFYNNWITNSSASGGAIYTNKVDAVTITNTIFHKNAINETDTSLAGSDLKIKSGSSTVTYSLTQKNSSVSSGTGIINNSDPLFFYPSTGDLRLQAGSGVADAGTSTGAPSTDIYGNARSGSYDMGATEGEFNGCSSSHSLPTTASTTYTASYYHTDGSAWTHYCSSDDKLLLSIKWGGNSIADADKVQLKLGASTTTGYCTSGGVITNTDGYEMIDRRWDLDYTGNTLTSNPSVRYYFTTAEYNAVKSALGSHQNCTPANAFMTVNAATDLSMYKLSSSTAFQDPHASGATGTVITNDATASTTKWVHSTHTDGHIAEYEVSSFSGGGGGAGGGGGNPLPVELINFNVTKLHANTSKINWATATEINNSHFVIERSYDGLTFEAIERVEGNGNSQEILNYAFLDNTIGENQHVVYYRLNQFDYDGANELSEVRKVIFDVDNTVGSVDVYPNPFNNTVFIQTYDESSKYVDVEIKDLNGRLVYSHHSEMEGNLLEEVNVDFLNTGMYMINISTENSAKTYRVLKQ